MPQTRVQCISVEKHSWFWEISWINKKSKPKIYQKLKVKLTFWFDRLITSSYLLEHIAHALSTPPFCILLFKWFFSKPVPPLSSHKGQINNAFINKVETNTGIVAQNTAFEKRIPTFFSPVKLITMFKNNAIELFQCLLDFHVVYVRRCPEHNPYKL